MTAVRFSAREAALALMAAEAAAPDGDHLDAVKPRTERRGCVVIDLDAAEAVKAAARMEARKALAGRRIDAIEPKPRRDLAPDYVDAVRKLACRDAARSNAARFAGNAAEADRVGRIVAARIFGIYEHASAVRVVAALVGGRGDTAAGWSW